MTHAGWHAILWLGDDERRHTLELYDLESDPGCTQDRAGDERARGRDMRRALIGWLADAPELRPSSLTEEALQRARREYGMVQGRHPGAWIDPRCPCAACASWD
jgi:hypothetical protein